MSGPVLLASLLLLASLVWALYDEFYGLRPWKDYQKRFQALYADYLEKLKPEQRGRELAVRQSAEFQRLEQAMLAAEQAVAPRVHEIDRQTRLVEHQIAALTDTFQTARGEVTALVYELETAGGEAAKKKLRAEIEEVKRGPFQVRLPQADGTLQTANFTYEELEGEFNRLKDQKAQLLTQRAELLAEANRLRRERDTYLNDHLVGLAEQQLDGLTRQMEGFEIGIRQIHVLSAANFAVPETVLVDRCQSCHVGMDQGLVPPNLTLTKAALGVPRSTDAPFTSHPTPELLRIHDPEQFGCSPCHGGNGRATTSVTKGHGRHKYWLWPLFYRENFQAGCQQCHAKDFVLEHASVLNEGKALFRLRGCVGCHRYEGFDNEAEQLQAVQQDVLQLEKTGKQNELEITRSIQQGDEAETNQEAQRYYQQAENLRVTNSNIDAQIEQLERRSRGLLRAQKKVGPNLKEIRLKLRPEWIPVWLENPHAWRPTTKMPRFRLDADEIEAISAFIWQSSIQTRLPRQPLGNPQRGKELFESRGCMACHSVGGVGGDFAADLSRLGEKANYDYIVRWIHNPRERTLPYCPYEKRDIGPRDYARKGLPFVFDLEHSKCPNDGHELQVQQVTVMPSLRLTWQEARDIASYLLTLRQEDPGTYPRAPFLDDPELKGRGRQLVRHYGCAGCHEIAGYEEEGRIGTELTNEGSKPIERLDFALLTEKAKRGLLPDGSKSPRGRWYDHKGFFERKLTNPATFDQGKVKEPRERLRMPTPNLTPEQVTALTTFLLGSVDPTIPQHLRYEPADHRQDIQAGWWIATKYNCVGCHQVRIGQESVLMSLPQYQTPEGKEQLPPSLIGAGARLNPEWMKQFLENPALSETQLDRNGVRPYLRARMPTFYLSTEEIAKLVRFFQALSTQPLPYIPPKLEPLTGQERMLARQLFTHPAAPCLRCHATGDPAHDRTATAPNFLLAAERLKPAWTERWIVDPARMQPGTSMPSGLFRREGNRWVFAGPTPESFRGYRGDHADLLVRYMFQFTPEEQRLLTGRAASANRAGGERANLVQSQ
ncbi:MAG: c-type cytochrome [Acidobacteria bacterium]|nr:c-type cytochrome [Acidobacteriota bacterium]